MMTSCDGTNKKEIEVKFWNKQTINEDKIIRKLH